MASSSGLGEIPFNVNINKTIKMRQTNVFRLLGRFFISDEHGRDLVDDNVCVIVFSCSCGFSLSCFSVFLLLAFPLLAFTLLLHLAFRFVSVCSYFLM